jgi:hypothetical protein
MNAVGALSGVATAFFYRLAGNAKKARSRAADPAAWYDGVIHFAERERGRP